MRVSFAGAAIAGIVGTVAYDMVGQALTGRFWDVPSLLGSKLFGEGALAAGVFAHRLNGVLPAVIYATVAPSLWGNRRARAMRCVTAETVFGVWFFMTPVRGRLAGTKGGCVVPADRPRASPGLRRRPRRHLSAGAF